MLDTPTNGPAHALVILVHGYGETDAIAQNWYYDLRARFADLGISSFVWDKPGCGASEGTFDADQPVMSSAAEVVAAAAFLRAIDAPGAQKIGLWGISRAGWIAPLALSQDKRLAFWISVSGVDDKESFGYLLASNWRIEGYGEDEIDLLFALFGEKDSIVDWRSTRKLYEATIGSNPNADLTIKTFPNGNHNLHQSDTGGFKEMISILSAPRTVPGYYDAITLWLEDIVED